MEKIAGQVTEDVSVPSQADILSEIGRSTEEKHVKEACKGSTERKHGKEARRISRRIPRLGSGNEKPPAGVTYC